MVSQLKVIRRGSFLLVLIICTIAAYVAAFRLSKPSLRSRNSIACVDKRQGNGAFLFTTTSCRRGISQSSLRAADSPQDFDRESFSNAAPIRTGASHQGRALARAATALLLGSIVTVFPNIQQQQQQGNIASIFAPSVANAASLEDVNGKLSNYGLPPMLFVPQGYSPLVSEYGRGNNQEAMTNPILVQMAYPSLWIVQSTSVNNNGESGTVSANDYIKGDSAFLFVLNKEKSTEKLSASSKDLIRNFVLKSLSQKGDPVDGLKLLKIAEGPTGADGQPYIFVDFAYQLNTEAGFLINRQGVLSLTSVGTGANEGSLQGLVSVTTDKRWRKAGMEEKLREIAQSFRVYRLNSGVFAADNAK